MYEQVFNFNSRPFTVTPYVKHYFPASSIHQALGQAFICVDRGSGPVVALGGIGTGKSLFLAILQEQFSQKFSVVNLSCWRDISRKEFLQNMLFQLGRPVEAGGDAEMRFSIIEAAQPSESSPNGILVLIDDAEFLPNDIFDEIRLLMNFVVEGLPRVRFVLAGQPSLEDRLADPQLASFGQRIACRVLLQNLSLEDTRNYVVTHIDRVGGSGATLFSVDALDKIHELTTGCPRQINQVCDFVLILAGTRNAQTITGPMIEEAWADVQSMPGGGLGTATAAESPSDWTVIEFGQLGDEGDSDANQSIEISPLSEQESSQQESEETTDTAVDVIAASAPAASSPVDDGLGIDFAALQAKRDAQSVNDATPNVDSAAAAAQAKSLPTETPTPSGPENDHSANQQPRSESDLAAQLSAVFGGSVASPAPIAASESAGLVQPQQPQFTETQPVDQTPPNSPQPIESGNPAYGLPVDPAAQPQAEMPAVPVPAQYVPAAQPAAPPQNIETSPPPAAPAMPVPQSQPELQATDERVPFRSAADVSQVPFTISPGEPESPGGQETPDTSSTMPPRPVETSAQQPSFSAADFAAPSDDPVRNFQATLDQLRQNDPQVDAGTTAATVVPATTELNSGKGDPFAESFDQIEAVNDRFTPEIARQNQNALNISKSDLTFVQPLASGEVDAATGEPAAETDSSPSQGLPSNARTTDGDSAAVNSPVVPEGVSWFATETPQASGPANTPEGFAFSDGSTPSNQTPPLSSDAIAADVPSSDAISAPAVENRISGFKIGLPTEPQTPAAEAPVDRQPAQQETAQQDSAPEPIQTASDNLAGDLLQRNDDQPVDEEISRQADEILKRLKGSAAPESSDAPSEQPTAIPEAMDNEASQAEPDQMVLDEIRRQQQMVSDIRGPGTAEFSTPSVQSDVESISPATLPMPEQVVHQDDSEMLVVHEPVESTSEVASQPDTESHQKSDDPISPGRAERMDYEKLFDRLRDMPEN